MRRCRSAPLVIAPRSYQPLPPLSPVGRQTSPFGICRMPDVSPVQIIPACDRTGPGIVPAFGNHDAGGEAPASA